MKVPNIFTKTRREIFSQLFVNLAAGWFGVVVIIPGITKLDTVDDWLWLTKNILFGMLALLTAMLFAERRK